LNTRPARLLAAAAAVGLVPAPALGAQPSSRDRVWNLAANGALGGAAAAVRATIAGRDPVRAFVRGAGGGLIVGAGRQVASSRFDGAGLLGRQLSASGISVIRGATEDTAAWLVPVGPLKLWIVPRSEDRLRARLNLTEVTATLYYVARRDARLDGRASLSAGAPVFRIPERTFATADGEAVGRMDAGIILLGAAESPYRVSRDEPLAHEAVHILQLDFGTEVLTAPVETWALQRIVGRRAAAMVDAGILSPLILGGLNSITAYGDRPWEHEASKLSDVRPPAVSGPVLW
jgi:hypothetical protein